MRLLVLGGTRFVGRVIVEAALGRGYAVTTFNRGRSGRDAPGVQAVRGDREVAADLARLVAGRSWDAVVDTSGYVPRVVGDAARALASRCERYAFLSTVSVYPGWPAGSVSEAAPVYDCAPDVAGTARDEASWSAARYGRYKAGCERAVQAAFGGRALVLRAGVILGPYENVGRLTWWLGRIARGGLVLAPGVPERAIQPIDVRDLAGFTLDCVERGTAGTFNVAAPAGHATFGELLASCVEVTGARAELVWVDDRFLLDHGVAEWTELPLWRTPAGTWAVATGRAQAAGLACRPLAGTVGDTWRWLRDAGAPAASQRRSSRTAARSARALASAAYQRWPAGPAS